MQSNPANQFTEYKSIYSAYIATNYPRCTFLYTSFTNSIFERDSQHRNKINRNNFTAKYSINRIVYYKSFDDVRDAIQKEKQIKAGSRKSKINLINSINPEWKNLIDESY